MTDCDHRFPGITFAHIRGEIDRTLQIANLEQSVAKGYMTRSGAIRYTAMIEALHQDAIRFAAAFDRPSIGQLPYAAPTHGISWHDLRAWLRAELDRRQRTYADAIGAGKTTEATATSQFDRLAALLAIYEDGHDFPPPNADYEAIFGAKMAEIPTRRRANFTLFLDTAAPVAAATLFGEASGPPTVTKGLIHDRPHHPA